MLSQISSVFAALELVLLSSSTCVQLVPVSSSIYENDAHSRTWESGKGKKEMSCESQMPGRNGSVFYLLLLGTPAVLPLVSL